MESKHISEMNRTEIMETLSAAMPALDEIKQHWMAVKQCERQIEELNQQKEEYLYPHLNSYVENNNRSNHPNSASLTGSMMYWARVHGHKSDRRWFCIIGLFLGGAIAKLLGLVKDETILIALGFTLVCVLLFGTVLYGRYKNWLIHHADKKFTTVPAEEEIATHKQAIADIENRSYDVFDPIPPAYRTSYAAHSIYNILNNGRAKTWERATDVYENEKARNDMYESMSKATAAAQRQAEAAMAQAEVAQQRADDAEWEAAQATSAARCAERKAQVDAAEAERRAMAYTNSRHF